MALLNEQEAFVHFFTIGAEEAMRRVGQGVASNSAFAVDPDATSIKISRYLVVQATALAQQLFDKIDKPEPR